MSAPGGIARDSCPFCGERPRFRWWDYIPSRYGSSVDCNLCGATARVATQTNMMGVLSFLFVVVAVIFALMKPLGPKLTIPVALIAGLAVAMGVMRVFMRLDPPDQV